MPTRTRLEDMELSRIEKICSDLRMASDNFEVEIIHKPERVYPVKIRVTPVDARYAMTGGQVDIISTFCARRGLHYIVLAVDRLSFEIF